MMKQLKYLALFFAGWGVLFWGAAIVSVASAIVNHGDPATIITIPVSTLMAVLGVTMAVTIIQMLMLTRGHSLPNLGLHLLFAAIFGISMGFCGVYLIWRLQTLLFGLLSLLVSYAIALAIMTALWPEPPATGAKKTGEPADIQAPAHTIDLEPEGASAAISTGAAAEDENAPLQVPEDETAE